MMKRYALIEIRITNAGSGGANASVTISGVELAHKIKKGSRASV
jgi:hypothetical protein